MNWKGWEGKKVKDPAVSLVTTWCRCFYFKVSECYTLNRWIPLKTKSNGTHESLLRLQHLNLNPWCSCSGVTTSRTSRTWWDCVWFFFEILSKLFLPCHPALEKLPVLLWCWVFVRFFQGDVWGVGLRRGPGAGRRAGESARSDAAFLLLLDEDLL